ncbi:MAG: hypothetical protein AB1942_13140 [Pseudomonadota bacterium]
MQLRGILASIVLLASPASAAADPVARSSVQTEHCVDAVVVGTLKDQAETDFPEGERRPDEWLPGWNTRWLMTIRVNRVLTGSLPGREVQVVSFHHAQMRSGYRTEWRLRKRSDGAFDVVRSEGELPLCRAGT